MQKFKGYCAGAILLVWTAVPATGQRGRDSYYNGMNDWVRRGDYNRYSEYDNRRHHHDNRGGIGPGKAALIGGGGGALLGAVFGGGLKGSLIGGAAVLESVPWAEVWHSATIDATVIADVSDLRETR